MRSLTADKGYQASRKSVQIQESDIRDGNLGRHAARRRKEGRSQGAAKLLHRAACAVKSQSCKGLLRKRGMHLERSLSISDEGDCAEPPPPGT